MSSSNAFVANGNKKPATNCCGSQKQQQHTKMSAALLVDESGTRKSVQDYYGKELQTSDDLKTNACCTGSSPPKYIQNILKQLHPETLSRYYGCGLCLPNYPIRGKSVLDLGCGAGRDVYIASALVGAKGRVVGVDMTTEQLEAAISKQEYHKDVFGYQNTEFVQGYLESLDEIECLKPNSFDVIVSNCVLNLCTDKQAVLNSVYKLLKPGGEFYFSDVYCNRRVPTDLQQDSILYGECLSGALYWNDFMTMSKKAGFVDPRLVDDSPITIQNKNVQEKVEQAGLEFYSATYRLWKLDNLEPDCEDYGQSVTYKGTMQMDDNDGAPSNTWKLDKGNVFEAGKVYPVSGNTWNMLKANKNGVSRHFDYIGDFNKHYGIFEGRGGTSSMPYDKDGSKGGGCCDKDGTKSGKAGGASSSGGGSCCDKDGGTKSGKKAVGASSSGGGSCC